MTSFRPNWKGFEAMATGPEIRAALKDVAEKGKAIAEAMAEEFRTNEDHPHYADSFGIAEETEIGTGQYGNNRAAVRLYNDSDHALAVEFGNARTPEPHRVLRRTLGELGVER